MQYESLALSLSVSEISGVWNISISSATPCALFIENGEAGNLEQCLVEYRQLHLSALSRTKGNSLEKDLT